MCSVSQTDAPTPGARRVGFSLGSNSGDRLQALEQACDALCESYGDLRLSRVYETEPVDCPPGSPAYLNACVEVFTACPAEDMLVRALQIEQELGRVRSGVYGEPRTCDIDLLYCGEEVIHSPRLTLPHPHAHRRRFVLQPLCDIDPSLILPGQQKTVSTLLAELPEKPLVTPFDL